MRGRLAWRMIEPWRCRFNGPLSDHENEFLTDCQVLVVARYHLALQIYIPTSYLKILPVQISPSRRDLMNRPFRTLSWNLTLKLVVMVACGIAQGKNAQSYLRNVQGGQPPRLLLVCMSRLILFTKETNREVFEICPLSKAHYDLLFRQLSSLLKVSS